MDILRFLVLFVILVCLIYYHIIYIMESEEHLESEVHLE